MGLSTSILNEEKTDFIKGRTQAELNNFASVYRKQYTLAFLSHVHDQLVQRKPDHPQLLKQKDPPEEEEVIYWDNLLYFEDNRKWKEKFALVRASYCLECYDSHEAFMKNKPPLFKLLPTGGTILTTEEKYMALVNKRLPDTVNVKQILAPPVVGMPGQFPVYLRMPYQKDHYFCLLQEAKQTKLISILSDCIRHQNQDFLKKTTYEVKAFVKAVQLYRQEKGHYESWEMLIGRDVQVMANLVMEDLLPSIEKAWLPHLKAKKTQKKRRWLATVDASYNLVQETLKGDMMALINECRETAQKQSALMSSDMDQIMSSRAFLESKLRAAVAESALDYCMQNIEPNLPALLEEIMGPISLGFNDARQLSESMMEKLCKTYQEGMTKENLQQALEEMSNLNLQRCYDKVSGLQDHIQELQQSFSYPNWKGLEHSTQIDIQQLMKNVVYTFELLLNKVPQDTDLADAMVKAKNRVLKQYDYDSSTLRKKIFQEALINITLPSIKAHLAPTFEEELPHFEQYIFADYVNFISVGNVYEGILQQLLEKEVSKVVKEAASMKKHNLFTESRYNFSVSSLHHTPPDSPAFTSKAKGSQGQPSFLKKPQYYSMPASYVLSLVEDQANGENSITALEETKTLEPESTVFQQAGIEAQAELSETHEYTNAEDGQKKNEKAMLKNRVEIIAAPTPVMEEAFPQSLTDKAHNVTEGSLVDAVNTVNSTSSVNTTPALTNTPHTLAETIPKPVETNEAPAEPSAAAGDNDTSSATSESSTIVCSSRVLQTLSDEPSLCSGHVEVGPNSDKAPSKDFSRETSLVTEEEEAVVRAEDDGPLEIIVGPGTEKANKPLMAICEGIKDDALCLTNGCIDPNTEAVEPLDCIKQIRDLVVEVIEVEELIQPYASFK